MNFFKIVFSDDLGPFDPPARADSDPDSDSVIDQSPTASPEANPSSTWSFGGLIRTLADKSESVIESYRRDIEELGSGLKKETAVIRTVASRAVNESLEKGASVAQESLESVGQAIDDIGSSVWKSTAKIMSQGREVLLASSDQEESDSNSNREFSIGGSNNQKPYSRFDMQLHAVQSDVNTYCAEPENMAEIERWRSEFDLEDKRGEIEGLMGDNSLIAEIYEEVVPGKVDHVTFWSRYFYKLHKLEEAEAARAKLMQRANSGEQEDLRWDFDEDEEESDGSLLKRNVSENEELEKKIFSEDVERSTKNDESSWKDSDVSVVSSQPSMPEDEDLGWDEIEEVGSNDETRGEAVGSASRADLRERLNAAEEEEDLSWEIDDEVDGAVVKS